MQIGWKKENGKNGRNDADDEAIFGDERRK